MFRRTKLRKEEDLEFDTSVSDRGAYFLVVSAAMIIYSVGVCADRKLPVLRFYYSAVATSAQVPLAAQYGQDLVSHERGTGQIQVHPILFSDQ